MANTKKQPTPLRSARAKVGWTQEVLAHKAGLTLSTVSLAERTGYVTPATALRLAAALGVEVERITGEAP